MKTCKKKKEERSQAITFSAENALQYKLSRARKFSRQMTRGNGTNAKFCR